MVLRLYYYEFCVVMNRRNKNGSMNHVRLKMLDILVRIEDEEASMNDLYMNYMERNGETKRMDMQKRMLLAINGCSLPYKECKKLGISKNDAELECMYENRMGITSHAFIFYCLLKSRCIMHIKNGIYFQTGEMENTDEKQLVYVMDHDEYELRTMEYGSIVKNYIEVKSIKQPLRGISSYTLNDLQGMIMRIKKNPYVKNRNVANGTSKKEVYDELLVYMRPFY